MNRSMPGPPVLHYLPEFAQTHVWVDDGLIKSVKSMMPSNHLILFPPLLLLPSIFPSIKVFSNESAFCIRWLKYWSFIFNISPSNEHSGLISFRMDRLDLLAVQGTLMSLLQHHNLNASPSLVPSLLMVQLSHPYMTTGKTIALTRQTFVSKWCLCFLMHCLGLLSFSFLRATVF